MGELRLKKGKVMLAVLAGSAALLAGCSGEQAPPGGVTTSGPIASAVAASPKLGIRPHGDTELQIDMSKIRSPDLRQVFDYIDTNIDEHVLNLQRWIQQPSISNTGEGIQESAYMVEGFFDQLGCQETQVYDVGTTDWGQQGNPVVYAKCDEGAEKTLIVYWMYDTMPVTQPDLWKAPPFEGPSGRTGALQQGHDRPRRHQLQGRPDGILERHDVHQGGHRQAARQHHLRGRR